MSHIGPSRSQRLVILSGANDLQFVATSTEIFHHEDREENGTNCKFGEWRRSPLAILPFPGFASSRLRGRTPQSG